MYRRGKINTGGYRFEDAGDGQGVWTDAERAAEGARRRAAQAAAAAQAEANTQARIDATMNDATLTAQQKVNAIAKLTASGYSRAEFEMIQKAREEAESLL